MLVETSLLGNISQNWFDTNFSSG